MFGSVHECGLIVQRLLLAYERCLLEVPLLLGRGSSIIGSVHECGLIVVVGISHGWETLSGEIKLSIQLSILDSARLVYCSERILPLPPLPVGAWASIKPRTPPNRRFRGSSPSTP